MLVFALPNVAARVVTCQPERVFGACRPYFRPVVLWRVSVDLELAPKPLNTMAISDALKDAGDGIKSAVGLGHSNDAPSGRAYSHLLGSADNLTMTAASHQQMSDARLPLAYRDSCAHLLIPLNKCRRDEYYLPWKCEV